MNQIMEALEEMIERSWSQDQLKPNTPKQEVLELETLADLRKFIKTMPENTVASIEIRVVLRND